MTEISTVQTEVTPLDVEVTASNSAEITTVEDGLDVTITKKEYKIVGDEVYIAKLYDDAPQWMKDLVQLVVDNAVELSNIQLLNNVVERLNQFATSYVPLNTYTQRILDLSNADASMHTLIETINSNFNGGLNEANAQIIWLETTKASKDEVIAQVLTTISAQLATPSSDLGAMVASLQQAIVTGDSANASSIDALMSSLEGEVDARATAVGTLDTRVTATETAITAQATDITALTTEVNNGTNTWAAADSQVTNSLTTKIENDVASVESKWAYNSIVNINGVYKRSGFGLTSNYSGGSGTEVDPYTSEFWIDATKLKFTNSATTGRTAPFTIDASGTTPQITFNGKVSFSNVTDVPQLGSTPQEVVNAVNAGNTTTINGGRITTGSITANQIAANSISADRISSYNLTSTNAVFENGIITNAKIANASIDNAKISDLSVSTLKIQDEAVVVPRSASGGYSCTIYYTPNVSHAATILGEWVQGAGRTAISTRIAINGVDVRAEVPSGGTLCSMFYNTYFYAGTPYAITLYTVQNTGDMTCRLLMLGTKK